MCQVVRPPAQSPWQHKDVLCEGQDHLYFLGLPLARKGLVSRKREMLRVVEDSIGQAPLLWAPHLKTQDKPHQSNFRNRLEDLGRWDWKG